MNTINISYENKKHSASGELEKELMAAVAKILECHDSELFSIQFTEPQEIQVFNFMTGGTDYLKEMFDTYIDLSERKLIPPWGVVTLRSFDAIKEILDTDHYNDIEDFLFDMVNENAFIGFLAGISFSRIVFLGTDEALWPQSDAYEKVIAQLSQENG